MCKCSLGVHLVCTREAIFQVLKYETALFQVMV
jgi:hypothetical protein